MHELTRIPRPQLCLHLGRRSPRWRDARRRERRTDGERFSIGRRKRIVDRSHHIGHRGRFARFDANTPRAEHQKRRHRCHPSDLGPVLQVRCGPHQQSLGHVHRYARASMSQIHMECSTCLRERAQHPCWPGRLHSQVERTRRIARTALDRGVRLDQRREAGSELLDIRFEPRFRPQLVSSHDEKRCPPETRIPTYRAHRVRGPTSDPLDIDHDHIRIDRARLGHARALTIDHDDMGSALPKRLHQLICARRTALDEHDAALPKERIHIDVGRHLIEIELTQFSGRRLLELPEERFGTADERPYPLDELLDGLRDGPVSTEHDARTFSASFRGGHSQNSAAQPVRKELDDFVDARVAESARRLSRALRQFARELGNTTRHRVGTRTSFDDRDRAETKRTQSLVEIDVVREHGHRHDRRRDVARKLREHRAAFVFDGIPQEQHEIWSPHEHRIHTARGVRSLDGHTIALERMGKRVRHGIPRTEQEHGRFIVSRHHHRGLVPTGIHRRNFPQEEREYRIRERRRGFPASVVGTGRVFLVIGLDCAAPALVFDQFRAYLPCVSTLMADGAWGPLRSTVPPITMPAWACMLSGRDPGELGIYGFRNRIEGSRALRIATSADVRVPRVWDLLARAGKRSNVLFVPPTWPPPENIEGTDIVSCMLTPSHESPHTHPTSLARELEARFGPHRPDVVRHAGSLERFIDDLHETAAYRFDVAEHMLETRKPDFLMMVEMGTDRLHHAAWPSLDPEDPRHDPDSPMVRDARDFYAYLDARIGRLVERAGAEATVMIVSDHGARPLRGGVRVNEWLRREGWLTLRSEPEHPCPLEHADVDWPRTRAWAEGGYFARININVRGRFPDGSVDPSELDRELDRLEHALLGMQSKDGRPMRNRVVRPRHTFRETNGLAPDFMVFFDDLDQRALGEIGGPIFASPEDAGTSGGRFADGCNHDWDGLFVLTGPRIPKVGRISGASIHDVGVTVLEHFGVNVPEGWLGRDLRRLAEQAT